MRPPSKRPRTAPPSGDSDDGDTNAPSALPSHEIIKIVDEILAFTGTETVRKNTFKTKYPFFAEYYPALFATACSPGFDYSRFRYMMTLREEVATQQRSLDDASKEVGQVLFDQYVAPVIDVDKEKK
jgi:hypothetical protein